MKLKNRRTLFRSRDDLNYPSYFIFKDGRETISFVKGRHTGYETNYLLISEDKGRTWLPYDNNLSYFRSLNINRLSGDKLLCWAQSQSVVDDDKKHYLEAAVSYDEGKNWAFQHMPVAYTIGGKFSSTGGSHIFNDILELEDGTLLQGIIGATPEDEEDRYAYAMVKRPEEEYWHIRSKVFSERTGEMSFAMLPDKRIVCVSRTQLGSGSNFNPLIQAHSDDLGFTWSSSVKLEHTYRGAAPQLHFMGNGVLLLVVGTRPEETSYIKAMTSTDGGETWSEPFIVFEGPGCAYADVVPLSDNECRILYSESSFGQSKVAFGERRFKNEKEYNKICTVDLEI